MTFLFVQNASAGRLTPVLHKRDIFTLSLQGADAHIFFFTDRPLRESGVIRTASMVPSLFAENRPAPIAALEFLTGRAK